MAYKISDDCIGCGSCASECPVEAISEKDGKYVIDPDLCLDCGSCASVCPVDARLLNKPTEHTSCPSMSYKCRRGFRNPHGLFGLCRSKGEDAFPPFSFCTERFFPQKNGSRYASDANPPHKGKQTAFPRGSSGDRFPHTAMKGAFSHALHRPLYPCP